VGGGTTTAPSVVDGAVYVGASESFPGAGNGGLYVFDAAGTQNCSGPVTARVCNPLWRAAGTQMGQPAVALGRVFVGSNDGVLYVFDAAGQTNCAGSPKTCQPVMRAAAGGTPPAIANDVVYMQNARAAKVFAFDATGQTGCSDPPTLCAPLWSADNFDFNQVPLIVANGVVYFGDGSDLFGYTLGPDPRVPQS
jgi:outer membrane protein assembly factor BamB